MDRPIVDFNSYKWTITTTTKKKSWTAENSYFNIQSRSFSSILSCFLIIINNNIVSKFHHDAKHEQELSII